MSGCIHSPARCNGGGYDGCACGPYPTYDQLGASEPSAASADGGEPRESGEIAGSIPASGAPTAAYTDPDGGGSKETDAEDRARGASPLPDTRSESRVRVPAPVSSAAKGES